MSQTRKTVRDLLRSVYQRRWLFAVSATVFAVGAMGASHMLKPKYTGTTIFELRSDPAGGDIARRSSASLDAVKLTLRDDLGGYGAVQKAAEDLGLTRALPRDSQRQLTLEGRMAEQELVGLLMAGIQLNFGVSSGEVTRVQVSVTHADAALAEQLPNTLVHNYIDRVRGSVIESFRSSMESVKSKLRECEARAQELSNEKIKFERDHVGGVPPDVNVLEERMLQLNTDIETRRLQHETARQKLARWSKLMESTSQPATQPVQWHKAPNPELKRLKEQLRQLEDSIIDAREVNGMRDEHPSVQALLRKIEQVQQRIKETEEEVIVETIYGSTGVAEAARSDLAVQVAAANAEIESLASELERLENRLTTYRNLMANFSKVRQEYSAILKKIADQASETQSWQSKYADLQMAFDAEMMNRRMHLSAIQMAQKQFRPSFPRLWTILAGAFGGAIACGLGLVMLMNSLDRSITSVQDGQALGLPLYGATSRIVTASQLARQRLRRWTLVPSLGTLLLAALALSAASVVMWLEFPQDFEIWKANPLGAALDAIRGLIGG
jgi:uncharacterized protein involved in exopolysaccharide biosynthesis